MLNNSTSKKTHRHPLPTLMIVAFLTTFIGGSIRQNILFLKILKLAKPTIVGRSTKNFQKLNFCTEEQRTTGTNKHRNPKDTDTKKNI